MSFILYKKLFIYLFWSEKGCFTCYSAGSLTHDLLKSTSNSHFIVFYEGLSVETEHSSCVLTQKLHQCRWGTNLFALFLQFRSRTRPKILQRPHQRLEVFSTPEYTGFYKFRTF